MQPLALVSHLLFQRVSVHFEIQLGGRLGEESRGRLRCPRLSLGCLLVEGSEDPDKQTVNPVNHRVGLR